jgi:pyruvate,water dikinase
MPERARIVFPAEDGPAPPELVGGKASTLIQLARHSFPVPSFVVVTTSVYFEQLKNPPIAAALHRWQTARTEEERSLAAHEISRSLATTPIPRALSEEIRQVLSQLGESKSMAVRSSATVEDRPGYSFAGIFRSELGVVGREGVESAIRRVWASLWNPAALAYFRRVGLDPQEVGMAVILQELVRARAAGVAFGSPAQGEPVRVEAVAGLGKALVDGEVVPDRFLVDVAARQVCQKHVGGEERQLVAARRGGVRWVTRSDRTPGAASVDEETAVHVADWVLSVQGIVGQAVDIEWSVDDQGRLFLVQARPITAGLRRQKPRRVWTGYFFLERFPSPVSPLGWDLLRGPVEQRAFRDPLALLGHKTLAKGQLTRLCWGRPYTDLRVFRALYGWVPRRFLSQDKRDLLDNDPRYRLGLWGLLRFGLRCLRFDANWFVPLHLWLWRRFVRRYTRAVAALEKEELSGLSTDALYARLMLTVQLSDNYLKLHRWSLTYADLFFQLIRWCAYRWLNWSAVQAAELVMDPTGDFTAQMNLELTEIARLAKADRRAWSRLKQGHFGEDALSQRLQDFFQRYGHRSNSLDPAVPNWRDDRDYVYQTIDRLIQQAQVENSIEARRRAAIYQLSLEQRFLGGMPRMLRPFGWLLLKTAREFVRLRENQRFYWQMSIAEMRRVCLEMGRRLMDKERLSTEEDVFYIRLEELPSALHGSAADFRRIVAERRQQHQRDARITPAQRLLEYEHGPLEPDSAPSTGERLSGLAISPGRSSGTARLVSDPRAFHRLRRGDILVTRSLDPGWTPVLGIVSGVVLEVGGMLSHGSILAREFGVPGVSNIPDLLERVADGDEVYVDGDRGEVVVGRARKPFEKPS